MSIYRKSCRQTERVAMKKLDGQGYSVREISQKIRVQPQVIESVLSGEWDSLEKAQTLVAMQANKDKMADKQDYEANKIAQIAAAAAAAIQGQVSNPAVSTEALRKEIEAQVRAEIAAETPVKPEMTRGEKAAATRKRNAEAALAQSTEDAEDAA